jgi:7-cyano-7-deazaguanine synthase
MSNLDKPGIYAIAIVSGGLDSVTMAYELVNAGYKVDVLSFNYGQRHVRELAYAQACARTLGLRHDIVDMTGLTRLINNSALTSAVWEEVCRGYAAIDVIDVPEGHYAEDNMRLTVVPNRNMIMFAIACGVAVNRQANTVAAAMHGGDHYIYPDCRPPFILSLGQAMLQGNDGFHNFVSGSLEMTQAELESLPLEEVRARSQAIAMGYKALARPITTPFLQSTKADIAYRALELGVPLHMTWSCYKGGENHCGRCGTCVERLEAIDEAVKRIASLSVDEYRHFASLYGPGTKWDRTVYEDTEFWKTVVAGKKREREAQIRSERQS